MKSLPNLLSGLELETDFLIGKDGFGEDGIEEVGIVEDGIAEDG